MPQVGQHDEIEGSSYKLADAPNHMAMVLGLWREVLPRRSTRCEALPYIMWPVGLV